MMPAFVRGQGVLKIPGMLAGIISGQMKMPCLIAQILLLVQTSIAASVLSANA
jgi:hypothetical protein